MSDSVSWRAPLWASIRRVVRRACSGALGLGALSVVAAPMAGAVVASPPVLAEASPLANPPGNLQPPAMSMGSGTCQLVPGSAQPRSPASWNCDSPCYPHWNVTYNGSRGCLWVVMKGINAAQRSEHLRPLALPSDFPSLSVPEQLFVLVNLERLSRGVPPVAGLSPYLAGPARVAAQQAEDPPFSASYGPVRVWWPPSGGLYGYGATWAGNNVDAAAAVFGWMYDDGWGGSRQRTTNFACTGPHAKGCWGHRDLLLGETTGTSCSDCVAGAGFARPAERGWADSYTFLLVRPVSSPVPLSFSWERDVVPYLPPGWERAVT